MHCEVGGTKWRGGLAASKKTEKATPAYLSRYFFNKK
jgi:hypothetical protein